MTQSEDIESIFRRGLAEHAAARVTAATEAYNAVLAAEAGHAGAVALLTTLDARVKRPYAASSEANAVLRANLDEIKASPLLSPEDRAFFVRYQDDLERLRQTAYFRFPQHIHIETQAVCNAACNFCPYPRLERLGARMSDELFAKIVDDLTAIPSDLPIMISPFKVSDPLLEKRLYDMIRIIQAKLPNARVHLATNGTALTDANIAKLAALKGPLDLHISLNDHRKNVYEPMMALPFDRTVARIEAVNAARARGAFSHPVAVTRVSGLRAEDDAFIDWVKDRFPALQVRVKPAGNWAGDVESRTRDAVMPIGCNAWFEFSITATGDVALCCMDSGEGSGFGNVKDAHVLDLYNSAARLQYRRAVSRREVSPCSACTYPEIKARLG